MQILIIIKISQDKEGLSAYGRTYFSSRIGIKTREDDSTLRKVLWITLVHYHIADDRWYRRRLFPHNGLRIWLPSRSGRCPEYMDGEPRVFCEQSNETLPYSTRRTKNPDFNLFAIWILGHDNFTLSSPGRWKYQLLDNFLLLIRPCKGTKSQ
jgi:hypothetical protein